MRANKPPTYLDFLQSLYDATDEQLAEFSFYLKDNMLQKYLFEQSPHGMYLHDYGKMSYPFISPNVKQSTFTGKKGRHYIVKFCLTI